MPFFKDQKVEFLYDLEEGDIALDNVATVVLDVDGVILTQLYAGCLTASDAEAIYTVIFPTATSCTITTSCLGQVYPSLPTGIRFHRLVPLSSYGNQISPSGKFKIIVCGWVVSFSVLV